MKRFIGVWLIIISSIASAAEQAETLFKQLAPSLYQIRLIDKASGEKSSIGSGFQISGDGLIATNYHVVSSYARHPEKYRIEFLDNQGKKSTLTLESIDVINDLALVKREVQQPMAYFTISDSVPAKGEELFSLGNPHDLGMIVVPGTYNGLKKESFNDRIHFTGSVNSGMSGGPVVNKDAQVVGINVATSGNQIGFLVPHDKLIDLVNNYHQDNSLTIDQQMSKQLNEYQANLIDRLLKSDWQLKKLGQGIIPTIDVPFIRCWGESNADKSDALMMLAVANCSLEENTYITSDFFTGSLEMEFRYLQAKKLSNTKFYRLFQRQIARVMPGNKAGKDDVTEFQCQHDIVMPSHQLMTTKSIFCTRAYKDFDGLYDALYLSISVDRNDQALLSHFTLAGVSQKSAQAFTKQFMESVSWK
ncbi:serine protease [Thalassotalea sp. G2M2-11]|uniref:S1 family peptidase n=1 Tax=Thalassotalea sp. G2M2-11 TaxID=2787627 RepID=UPI0019D031EC|nr:serine protease [Thalassotalea sp. G2M2-11]